jgi:thiosulfate/3-mercaptopyruvate sulfurtransferase
MRRIELFAPAAAVLFVACAGHHAAPEVAPAAAGGHQHGMPSVAAAGHQETMVHNRHYLMSAESLAARIGRPGTVVIHVGRTDSLYLAGHVPGARFLPFSAVARTVNGVANEFPPPDSMATMLSSLVIRPEDRIVLYGDDPLFAARLWVALDLMGQSERTALLDGGLPAWRARGGQVQPGPVPVPRIYIPFTFTWQPQKLVTAEWVRSRLRDSSVVLLDSRPADQFAGGEPPCAPVVTPCVQIPEARRGHIPGAKSIFWVGTIVSREDPRMKSMHDIHEGMLEPLGADAAHVRTLGSYCRTGVQASWLYFVLRWINYPDVRLYDGSFSEWAGMDAARFPVQRPQAGGMDHQHH